MNNPIASIKSAGRTMRRISIAIAVATLLTTGRVTADQISGPKPMEAHYRDQIRFVVVTTPKNAAEVEFAATSTNFDKAVRKRRARERASGVFDETLAPNGPLVFPEGKVAIFSPFMAVGYVSGLAKAPKGAEVEEYARFMNKDAATVAQACKGLAVQETFARAFASAAEKQGGRRFRVQLQDGTQLPGGRADAQVENIVESIHLEKTGKDLLSLAVVVRTRVSAGNSAERLYEDVSSYRSEAAAISDWAFNNAEPLKTQFARASEKISVRIARQILPSGAASEPTPLNPQNGKGLFVIDSTPLTARDLARLGNVGVISTCSVPMIKLQRPMTKRAAMNEVRKSIDDGLDAVDDQFALTRSVATVLSIPVSIGGQAYGGMKGLTKRELAFSDDALSRAAREIKVQPILRQRLLATATNATKQPIAEVKKPFPAGQEEEFRQFSCVMAGTLAWIPEGQTAQYYLQSQGVETVLELEIIRPALNAKRGGDVNPPMSFSSRVRASLWNVQKGEELAFCHLQYQSAERRFTEWSRNDAALFRNEINSFADAVSTAVTQQLSIPSWWTEPAPILATAGK